MKTKVLIFQDFPPHIKKAIEYRNTNNYELLYWHEMDGQQKENALTDSKYFLVTGTSITGDMIDKADKLRLIQRIGTGTENIDIDRATRRKIYVCNVSGGNSHSVAEFTIAMILDLYRKLTILDRATKNGMWLKWDYRLETFEMRGKTHGLIGMGNVGRETAKLSRAFGTKILYYNRTRLSEQEETGLGITYSSLDDVLKSADIISLHVPLSPQTANLIGKRELALMKKNAILINVSRGGIVDEQALCEALENNTIAGAGIDTFAPEPVSIDNPLLRYDNVLATPHVAGGTKETFEALFNAAFDNFDLVEGGQKPRNIVNTMS